METKHYYALAFAVGAVAGYFLMSGSNSYASGQWGASTFGWVYTQGAKLAAPSGGTASAVVNTGN